MTSLWLLSVQVGLPRTVGTPGAADTMERAFTSAIWKTPVAGPVRVGPLGLDGDSVADRRVHGGVDQAVLMYAGSHYPLWEAELGRPMASGAFGENLTLDGLTEDTVCIGDVLDIGEVRFEVSKPRQPCATLARRHQLRDMVARVLENGRSGWYLRVLREGRLQAGQPVELAARPHPEWPVRRAGRAMVQRARDPETAAELARCPALAMDWRATLARV